MALDKEETGARVLEIAHRLLEEGGAPNLKARTIAQEAGIAVGSIYNMYTDLTGLHRAVNVQLLDELGRRGAAAMIGMHKKGETDVRSRLLALAHAYHEFVQDHPGAWAAVLAYNRGRVNSTEPDEYVNRLDMLFDIIAQVIADGYPDMQPETRRQVARALWSSVHGIVTSGYASRGGARKIDQIWEQVDLLVTTFLAGLKQRGPALTGA